MRKATSWALRRGVRMVGDRRAGGDPVLLLGGARGCPGRSFGLLRAEVRSRRGRSESTCASCSRRPARSRQAQLGALSAGSSNDTITLPAAQPTEHSQQRSYKPSRFLSKRYSPTPSHTPTSPPRPSPCPSPCPPRTLPNPSGAQSGSLPFQRPCGRGGEGRKGSGRSRGGR